ncbi:hypothetical protein IAU59_006224 [Kwoniella sp. CBS 9459]
MSATSPIDELNPATLRHVTSAGDDKATVEYIEESKKDVVDIHSGEGLGSKFEDLGLIPTVRKFWKASTIAATCAFSAACDGYQISINGNVIANPGFIQTFGNQTDPTTGERILSASTLSAFSAMISVGQCIGMLVLPFIMDKFGRKWAMYYLWTILAISVLFESVAKTWPLWLVGKLFAGHGVGCLQLCIPTYIAEISPIPIRGAMITLYNIWWAIGQLFAPVALQVLGETRPNDWKTPIYTQWAMIGIMGLIFVFIVPESPWWAAEKGKHDVARRTLTKLNGNVAGYNVEEEYAIMVRTIELEQEMAILRKNQSWTALFKGINALRTLAAGWSLVSSQFLGLALIGTYTTYFFLLAGSDEPFKQTIITSCLGIASVIFCTFTIDKIGRYWLINSALTLCWISLPLIGGLSLIKDPGQSIGGALIFLACLWTFCNQMNYTCSWGMMAEVPSARLRAKTAGFAAACSSVSGIIMVVIVPYMINVNNANWGLKTCFFFCGVGAPFVIGGWLIIPETARRSPAELDELYESGVKPWRFRKTITKVQEKRAAGVYVEPESGVRQHFGH